MPSVHFVELQLKITRKMLLLDYLLFTLTSCNLHLCSSLEPWWTAVCYNELGFILEPVSNNSNVGVPVLDDCNLQTWSGAIPWISLDSEVNTNARESFRKPEVCYLLCLFHARGLEHKPLLLKQDCCKTKDNKCSKAIKIPCSTSALMLEGGHNSWVNRNHLWYIKPSLEICRHLENMTRSGN